jgi:hypothetical protein
VKISGYLKTATAVALLMQVTSALADSVTLNFELNIANGNPITDLFVYSTAPGGLSYLYTAPDVLAPTGAQSLTYTAPFTPTASFVLGFNSGGGVSRDHAMMFLNPEFAQSALGYRLNQTFAPYGEGQLLGWVKAAHAGDTTALGNLNTFLGSAQVMAGSFAPTGPFTILQFSIPVTVGNDIPEAGTVGAGLLLLVGSAEVIRRRRATPVPIA